MTLWTALTPIKPASERKTRLSSRLSETARDDLADLMLRHVLSVLERSASIGEVVVVASVPPIGWTGRTIVDQRRGLNFELAAAAVSVAGPLMILHADLPALTPEDVDAMAAAAKGGVALAPDRWSRGTNAMAAQQPRRLNFAFGADSFAHHQRLMPGSQVVRSIGFGLDIDLPGDLDEAMRSGRLPGLESHLASQSPFKVSRQPFTC